MGCGEFVTMGCGVFFHYGLWGVLSLWVVGSFVTMYRLLHEYGYLRYFRDLRNGIIITEGEV